jgi:hypothetical protein
MVFKLQPDIIVNNRNKLVGDFTTPEQRIEAAEGQAWETCMTMNGSWGYQAADDDWKTPKQIVRNLISCVRDGGNYLLNIGQSRRLPLNATGSHSRTNTWCGTTVSACTPDPGWKPWRGRSSLRGRSV